MIAPTPGMPAAGTGPCRCSPAWRWHGVAPARRPDGPSKRRSPTARRAGRAPRLRRLGAAVRPRARGPPEPPAANPTWPPFTTRPWIMSCWTTLRPLIGSMMASRALRMSSFVGLRHGLRLWVDAHITARTRKTRNQRPYALEQSRRRQWLRQPAAQQRPMGRRALRRRRSAARFRRSAAARPRKHQALPAGRRFGPWRHGGCGVWRWSACGY